MPKLMLAGTVSNVWKSAFSLYYCKCLTPIHSFSVSIHVVTKICVTFRNKNATQGRMQISHCLNKIILIASLILNLLSFPVSPLSLPQSNCRFYAIFVTNLSLIPILASSSCRFNAIFVTSLSLIPILASK